MFVYQNFIKFKKGEKIYIGETKIKHTKREGYGETIYPNGTIEKGIYINDHLVLKEKKEKKEKKKKKNN